MNELPPDLEALIFDAAAGDLSPEDAERLRAAIDADPSVADLVADQRSVASGLAPVPMSDLERARVHRTVRAAISPSTRATPGWARWAVAGAAAVVVVAAGGFALLSGGLDDQFGDIGAEVAPTESATADLDTAADGEERATSGDDAAEESTEGDAATGLAPEAGDGAADAGGTVAGFPACPGTIESAGDVAEETEAMLVGWPTPEAAASALDDVPDTWGLYAGEPVVDTMGDVAVVSWFDADGLLQQVELELGDLWYLSRRVTCSR